MKKDTQKGIVVLYKTHEREGSWHKVTDEDVSYAQLYLEIYREVALHYEDFVITNVIKL